MRSHYRTEGFILKHYDRGEADRTFSVFTKEFGKLHLWAVSERKITSKLRQGLEAFSLSELEFVQGRARKTVTDAFLKERYPVMRSELLRIRAAAKIAQTTDVLLNGEERDERIWELLSEGFGTVNDSAANERHVQLAFYYFFWNLVSHLGYRPRLSQYPAEMVSLLQALFDYDLPSFLEQSAAGHERILKRASEHYWHHVLGKTNAL